MVVPESSKILTNPDAPPVVPNTDLWSYLKTNLVKYDRKPAFLDHHTGVKLSYNEVIARVENLAAHFQDMGLGPGVYVSFQTHNCVESLLVGMAIIAAGAVLVPITLAYSGTSDELIQLVEITNSSYSYCTYKYIDNARGLRSKMGTKMKKYFIFGGEEEGFTTIDSLFTAPAPRPYKPPKVNPMVNDFIIIFTSGTTGIPKAIQHTHHNGIFLLEISKNPNYRMCEAGANFLAWHPMVHLSGFICSILALSLGAHSIVATSSQDGDHFGEIIENYKIQSLIAFPSGLWNMLQTMKKQNRNYDLSSVTHIIVGGSAVSKALVNEVHAIFPNLKRARGGYGLSETMGVISLTSGNQLDSCGKVAQGVQIKVVDVKTGEALGPNEEGEICIKSPGLMKAYLGREKDTAEAIVDGWFKSGDLGYYDEERNLFCVDRLKQMIKCLDCQTSPIELEDELQKHQAVETVAVVGITDENVGEAPTACVVLRPGNKASDDLAAELVQMINGKFARNKHLFGGVHFFSKLPLTDTGKIAKNELKKMVQDKIKSQ